MKQTQSRDLIEICESGRWTEFLKTSLCIILVALIYLESAKIYTGPKIVRVLKRLRTTVLRYSFTKSHNLSMCINYLFDKCNRCHVIDTVVQIYMTVGLGIRLKSTSVRSGGGQWTSLRLPRNPRWMRDLIKKDSVEKQLFSLQRAFCKKNKAWNLRFSLRKTQKEAKKQISSHQTVSHQTEIRQLCVHHSRKNFISMFSCIYAN